MDPIYEVVDVPTSPVDETEVKQKIFVTKTIPESTVREQVDTDRLMHEWRGCVAEMNRFKEKANAIQKELADANANTPLTIEVPNLIK